MSAPASWIELPLAGDGRSLVEASAGTGKTWTIGVLYLRLLLEDLLTPRQIIVSTFTNAAAAELRERLRAKMLWALAEAEGESTECAPDSAPDQAWLHARWHAGPDQRLKDTQRLKLALTEFDAAPVSTLHALCRRILADHPFASGALFRGRDLIDGKALETALAEDLWRVISQAEVDEPLAALAADAGISRSQLGKYMPALLQPNVRFDGFDQEKFLAHFAFLGDVEAWIQQVRELLACDDWFTKNCTLRGVWELIANLLESPREHIKPALHKTKLTTLGNAPELRGISATKGKQHPPIIELASQSVEIAETIKSLPALELDLLTNPKLRQFLAEAQVWCRRNVGERLEAANQSTFDQLLQTVRTALYSGDAQRALADALFTAWPVALVDEFQDTDPVQFSILDAIYRSADGSPRGRLVMIGDPKQAIYRFRGGDVQAYERAKRNIEPEDLLTLAMNFRSSRAYVLAINAFYARTGGRMGPEESSTRIEYHPVEASTRQDSAPVTEGEHPHPVTQPLILHIQDAHTEEEDLERAALAACAGQIAHALSPAGYHIAGEPLQPGDIAVLLPSHAQIQRLARMLKARGVPYVTQSNQSVFATRSANELQLLLHAAIHPDNPRAIRAAIATRLWGGNLADLHALQHDQPRWDQITQLFRDLHHELAKRGPQAVVAALLDRHAPRLLNSNEGERILTDVRHLGELLQEAWSQHGGGERLLAWFAQQRSGDVGGAEDADARALRLESDSGRVRLMTLHVSKGLEFPIVYLPLMWKHGESSASRNNARLLTDDSGQTKHLVLDHAKALVQEQEMEERFRILYVALTRAVHACHVFLLPHGDEVSEIIGRARKQDVPINRFAEKLMPASADESDALSIAWRKGWEDYVGVDYRDDGIARETRYVRPMPPPARGPLPMRHSFSTLTRRRYSQTFEDAAADDETLDDLDRDDLATSRPNGSPHPILAELAKVAGPDFGNAVHEIFEHRELGRPLSEQVSLVRQALAAYGVDPRDEEPKGLMEPLINRIQSVLDATLGGADGPCLGDLSAGAMRAEMEFNYVLDRASLARLRAICEQHGEVGLVPARDQLLSGLMNGKIDLVFQHAGRVHVLDYKSNRLSPVEQSCLEDYGPEALDDAMRTTGYRLQALLYVVAVERYLRERLGSAYQRSTHLGDCWYLFVRAVGLTSPDGQPCGVWRYRFDDALLDTVQSELIVHSDEELVWAP